jgi:fructokinase
MRTVYTVGETLLDIIFKEGQPQAAKPGGSSLNAAVTLGRLGREVEFIGEYGEDHVGDLVDRFLTGNNVGTQFVTRFRSGKSALALAFLDHENNASYSFYKDFPEERLSNIPGKTTPNDIVTFCSIYAITREVRPQLIKFLNTATTNGSLLFYDPNFRPVHLHELEDLRPFILENFRLAHIVRASDEDLKHIFKVDDPDTAYEKVSGMCNVLVYTANVKGVYVLTPAGRFQFPVRKVKTVSTIGAGDNFNAGLVYSFIRDGIMKEDLASLVYSDWEKIIATAVDFATEVCMSWENYVSKKFAAHYPSAEADGN